MAVGGFLAVVLEVWRPAGDGAMRQCSPSASRGTLGETNGCGWREPGVLGAVMTRPALTRLYALWPDAGPCGICGCGEALHREWDAIEGRLASSEKMGSLREEFPGRSRDQIAAVAAAYDEARRLHRPLPGREPRP